MYLGIQMHSGLSVLQTVRVRLEKLDALSKVAQTESDLVWLDWDVQAPNPVLFLCFHFPIN